MGMTLTAILAECARLARGGGAGALASVARRRGSLPMSATAKLLVSATGARFGTVGGGCLEGEIVERCLNAIERRAPATSEHALTAELAGDYGLTCGGTAVIVVEPVFPDVTLAAVYGAALALSVGDTGGAMATGLDWSRGPAKCVRDAAGALSGAATPDLVAALDALDPRAEEPAWHDGVLLERVTGAPRLVVFGGGHVGGAVARAAQFAGWRVTVVDDRADFADAARHPVAERCVTCDWHALPVTLGLDAATYCVVATRGHQHDALIVEQVARRPLRYLGMLGSRRKVALTWRLLESWGVDAGQLAAVHAPVGLAIGADTPEEIAISVVAEMIAVRRAASRRRGGVALATVDGVADGDADPG